MSIPPGAVALFPGEHGKPQLRPFPFTPRRDPSVCLFAGEQRSRAGGCPIRSAASSAESEQGAESPPSISAAQPSEQSEFSHVPVMRDEIVELFAGASDGTVVDATLGAGGHAEALLDTYPQMRVVGLDRDRRAIAAATERLKRFGDRFVAHHVRFDAIAEIVSPGSVSGVLFDLGVSSPQLDHGDRGFSHRYDGPLDMRMDDRERLTAFEVVNSYSEGDLIRVLRQYGDEPNARRIVRGMVANRPITTTGELVEAIVGSVPAAVRRQPRHPAMRSFQAIRIEVNSELDVLEPALLAAVDVLQPGARLVVLAYHSGEDRIVKRVMRDESRTGPAERPELPPPPGSITRLRLLWNGAHKPGSDEVETNPRSSSARLRAAERTEQGT